MMTGFNTDVDFEGRIFHVQTEDKGVDNPVVESLVYSGGEIVTSERSSYQDLLQSEEYSDGSKVACAEHGCAKTANMMSIPKLTFFIALPQFIYCASNNYRKYLLKQVYWQLPLPRFVLATAGSR